MREVPAARYNRWDCGALVLGLAAVTLVLTGASYSVEAMIPWGLAFAVILPLDWYVRRTRPEFFYLKTTAQEILPAVACLAALAGLAVLVMGDLELGAGLLLLGASLGLGMRSLAERHEFPLDEPAVARARKARVLVVGVTVVTVTVANIASSEINDNGKPQKHKHARQAAAAATAKRSHDQREPQPSHQAENP